MKKGSSGKVMADLYEFPYTERGSKIGPGVYQSPGPIFEPHSVYVESEEKGFPFSFAAKKVKALAKVDHSFTRFRVKLHPTFWRASEKKELPDYEWISTKEIHRYPFSSGHRKILMNLRLDHAHTPH